MRKLTPGDLLEIFNRLYLDGTLVEFYRLNTSKFHPDEDNEFYRPDNFSIVAALAAELNARMGVPLDSGPKLLTYGSGPAVEG